VFDPVICKIPDAPLPDEQLLCRTLCSIWLLLLVTIILCKFYANLSVYDSNCALHYRIVLEARSKRNFQVTGG